ncbi:MAG: chemotaxis response regulator protein-glutamate methylesterase [Verrucomicrobiota bacterium]
MRIGIVNDQPMAVEVLRRVLTLRPAHQIVWVTRDGAAAVAKCAQEKPDLILMDIVMPVMGGVEATRRIIAAGPCPILIVTANAQSRARDVFTAMGAGALDAVDMPVFNALAPEAGAAVFLTKLDQLERYLIPEEGAPMSSTATNLPGNDTQVPLLAIGASAGGPAALAYVLSQLPKNFPAAVVLIQHVDVQFAKSMAEWLNNQSALPVRLALEGESPTAGVVLLAGTNHHLRLTRSQRLGYTEQPVAYVYRPSVNVFFESVARYWSGVAVGVLLTGMGRDGAEGLKAMRVAGAHTITQDRATCAVYGMPKAAAELQAAVEILPLEQIPAAILRRYRMKAG